MRKLFIEFKMNRTNRMIVLFLTVLITTAFTISSNRNDTNDSSDGGKRIHFRVKGNGKTNVSLGVAERPGGPGFCCRDVSTTSVVAFEGDVGHYLFEEKTNRVIIKLYDDLDGQIIDLKDYY